MTHRLAAIFVAALALAASHAMAQSTGTPAASVSLSATGTSTPLPISAEQGAPVGLMLIAPGGATMRVDAAPNSSGPWTQVALVTTMSGSGASYNAATGEISTPLNGYTAALPAPWPYVRMAVTALSSSSATLALVQPASR